MTKPNTVILCHKCSGTLTEKIDARLYGCGCMSGYVRGFEIPLTAKLAIAKQIQTAYERLDLYKKQCRDLEDTVVTEMQAKLAKLLEE